MIKTAVKLVVWSCLIGAGSSLWAAKIAFSDDKIPEYNIPLMKKAPVIDGTIHPEEWRHAVKIMGLAQSHSSNFYARPHSFWVSWDKEHLYIAGRAHILEGHVMLKSRRGKFTTGVVFDDAFEFGISMLGRNTLPGEVESYFKFILNQLNSGEYMKNYPSIGQMMYNWLPELDVANKLHHTPQGTFWEIEIVMDLEDLQMPVENQDGDKIKTLLAADLKNPGWQWACFPSATGHLVHTGFPVGELTKNKPYIQIDQLDGFTDEKLNLKSVIYNQSEQPVKIKASVTVASSGKNRKTRQETPEQIALSEEKSLTIPAKGSVRFDVDKAFQGAKFKDEKDIVYTGSFEFKVILPANPKADPVFRSCMTFDVDKLKKYRETCEAYKPKREAFCLETQFNPVRNSLWVAVDTLDARIPANSKPAEATYEVSLVGDIVAQGKITRYVNYKYEKLIQLPQLKNGEYKVKLNLVDKNGQLLATRDDITFVKKDEAKVFAKWWNNNIGDYHKVLKQFEPLRVSQDILGNGTRVDCILRDYHMDGLGLPTRIVANNGELLADPVRIVVVIDNREYVVPTTSQLAVTDKKDWRIEFAGKSEVAGLKFSSKGWMEQDGLVNIDLTYEPVGKPVNIQELRVEWPIRDVKQNYMTVIGNGGNYCARYIDKVPDGDGVVWSTLKNLGKVGSDMTFGNFYRNVWIGNEDRGLLWWGESDEGWVPSEKISSHTILRDGTTLTLRNHIIGTYPGDQPYKLDKAKTVNLQYNASPFKKLTKGWRVNERSAANGFSKKPKYKVNWDTGKVYFTVLSPPFDDPARWPEYYKHCKEVAEAERAHGLYDSGTRLGPYHTNQIALRGYADKSIEKGVIPYFRGEWSASGGETLCKTYNDYMIWLMNRQVREGGCSHFYFDISFARCMKGLIAGQGYRLPDGRVQPTGVDDNLRRWYMRVMAMMEENGIGKGGVSGHATNSICLKALPFASAILDSEFPMKDPITVFPPNRMIALSNPHNFGCNINHLHFMNPEWASMHDSSMGGGQRGIFDKPEFRTWGIARDDIDFMGYWDNYKVVDRVHDGLLASFWKRPNSIIIEVLNYGLDAQGHEKARPLQMTLDLEALGIPRTSLKPGQIRVKEIIADEYDQKFCQQFKWWQEMKGERDQYKKERWHKFKKPIEPKLDTRTGALTGKDIQYHSARFIQIDWDERPVDQRLLAEFPSDSRDDVLDWGINQDGVTALPVNDPVLKADKPDFRIQTWKRPGSALIKVRNDGKKEESASIKANLADLGVKVDKLWLEFTQVFPLDGKSVKNCILKDENPQAVNSILGKGTVLFDPSIGEIRMRLKPGQERVFCIDKY